MVAEVGEGSLAESAGLLVDDLVLAIDGMPTATTNLVVLRRRLCHPGKTVSVEVQRGGRVKEFWLHLEPEGKRKRKPHKISAGG
jgi:regulator of sigma E protease